jgi:hypothetical protein
LRQARQTSATTRPSSQPEKHCGRRERQEDRKGTKERGKRGGGKRREERGERREERETGTLFFFNLLKHSKCQ